MNDSEQPSTTNPVKSGQRTELIKWFIGSVVVVLVPTAITGITKYYQSINETEIQNAKIRIAQEESIQKLLMATTEIATSVDIDKRLRFAEFYQLLAPSAQLKEGFDNYVSSLNQEIDERKRQARDRVIASAKGIREIEEALARAKDAEDQDQALIDELEQKLIAAKEADAKAAEQLADARNQTQAVQRLETPSAATGMDATKSRPSNETVAFDKLVDALESDNSLTRREARKELAVLFADSEYAPMLQSQLKDLRDRRYPAQLGIAVALRDAPRSWQPTNPIEAIAELTNAENKTKDKTLKQALSAAITNLSLASLEQAGFEALLDQDLEGAQTAFALAYARKPALHNVDEIRKLLIQQKAELQTGSANSWNSLLKNILEDYSWGMPAETKRRFMERSSG